MLVDLSQNQINILIAIGSLTEDREDNKKIYVNPSSISNETGLTWKTVKNNFKKFKNIKDKIK